jgi:hypothetical protein
VDGGGGVTTYTHRPWRVAAIEWTGDNFADVEQFVRDYIGDPNEIGLRNEPDEYVRRDGAIVTFNMIRFYAWGDDQEVDPGKVIVVPLDAGDDARGELMSADDFRIAYEAEVAA